MNTLQVAAGSPWWFHAGAVLILFLHIAGGTVGLLSGAAALAFRKGSRRHRQAGNVFFASMLLMAVIGAIVAPFLQSLQGDPRSFDSLMATFTLYLVSTGWATVRRKAGTTGRFEIVAVLFASTMAAVALMFGAQAASSPTGLAGGYNPQSYYVIGGVYALAAALDLNVIVRGGVSGAPRIARHLWRMCAALFIAAGSFFLGQQRVMPEFIQGSVLLAIPPFATLVVMVFWLLKIRLAKQINRVTSKRRQRRREAVAADLPR